MNVRYLPAMKEIIVTKKRVAAYARVSGEKDVSLHSLAAQVSYYSSYIKKNTEWEYAGVYADEGLTGTKENRSEFQRLLQDCKDGKIDLVITKSISRFARNTVTTIQTVRMLKEYGIDVWFERENIHSLSGDGELMLTILSSFAQEESRSASENQKWKIRKNFSEGRCASVRVFGYRREGDDFIVEPEEAEIVKLIFSLYLSGYGKNAIVKYLIEHAIGAKNGIMWHSSVIKKMLSNEKYVGDLLLQKSFTVDHLTKKSKKNKGELPQYLVRDNHEAIISREIFDAVQVEMTKRAEKFKGEHSKQEASQLVYEFTGKITCGKCGKKYRRKIVAKGKVVWICTTFNSLGKSYCSSQQIPEDILKKLTKDMVFSEIHIPCSNTVEIILSDGSVITKHWQNPSRTESWTEEMRQKARERSLKCQKQ